MGCLPPTAGTPAGRTTWERPTLAKGPEKVGCGRAERELPLRSRAVTGSRSDRGAGCDRLPPAAAGPGRRGRPDVRPAAADPAARLPYRRRATHTVAHPVGTRGGRRPAHVRARGPRAVAAGAREVRAGRPRRVVPHLRRVPQPQELRAVRQPASLGPRARPSGPPALARARPGDGPA